MAVVLALLVVAGCSGSTSYSDEVRTNFIKACLDTGGTMTSCECNLEYIESKKTEAEFVRIDAEFEYEGIVDDVINEALANCDAANSASADVVVLTQAVEEADRLVEEATRINDTVIRMYTELLDSGPPFPEAAMAFMPESGKVLFDIAAQLSDTETGDANLDEAFHLVADGLLDIGFGLDTAAIALTNGDMDRVDDANGIILGGLQAVSEGVDLRWGGAAPDAMATTTTPAPTTASTTTAESTTTTTVAVEATTTTPESTGESTPKRWVDENGVIEANGTYVLTDNLSLNGIIEGDATVPSGTTLELHGIITGDLTVLEGGIANIFGVLSGDLRAAGTVDISGIVDGSIQAEPSANVTIHPGSIINGVEQ